MIKNSYATLHSDGTTVTVNYFESQSRRLEGPATFPARYASFAAICTYIETQFNWRKLTTSMCFEIQGLLGAPWPHNTLRFDWKDCQALSAPSTAVGIPINESPSNTAGITVSAPYTPSPDPDNYVD
jgi:hypothetical protein